MKCNLFFLIPFTVLACAPQIEEEPENNPFGYIPQSIIESDISFLSWDTCHYSELESYTAMLDCFLMPFLDSLSNGDFVVSTLDSNFDNINEHVSCYIRNYEDTQFVSMRVEFFTRIEDENYLEKALDYCQKNECNFWKNSIGFQVPSDKIPTEEMIQLRLIELREGKDTLVTLGYSDPTRGAYLVE